MQNLGAKFWWILILTLAATTAACTSITDQFNEETKNEPALPAYVDAQPNPDLTPEDVVRIQVEALKNNDSQDTGIEITFRFASPTNKQATGPLFRFKELVKTRAYRPMLNHKLAEYEPLKISGNTATQRVTIVQPNGQAAIYLFELSKQDSPPCEGCWMTDSVIMIPTRQQDLKQI